MSLKGIKGGSDEMRAIPTRWGFILPGITPLRFGLPGEDKRKPSLMRFQAFSNNRKILITC